MTPATYEAVAVFMLFVIPGVISQRVLGAVLSRSKQDGQEQVLEAVMFSGFNAAFWGWIPLAFPDSSRSTIEAHRMFFFLSWILFLLVAPVAWALLWARVINDGLLARLARKMSLRYRHPTPRAWDFFFAQRRQVWVRITLDDGSIVAGLMGTKSFASSYPAAEDLYLETTYEVDDDGILKPVPQIASGGIWIQGKNIRFVEFITPSGEI